MEYCSCGSVMINGSCTNRRCKQHNRDISYATFKQIEHIKDMLEELNIEEEKFGLQSLNSKQAVKLIRELEEMIELGGQ